jgi:hypothetical protein
VQADLSLAPEAVREQLVAHDARVVSLQVFRRDESLHGDLLLGTQVGPLGVRVLRTPDEGIRRVIVKKNDYEWTEIGRSSGDALQCWSTSPASPDGEWEMQVIEDLMSGAASALTSSRR